MQAQINQQMVAAQVPLDEANLKNKKALYELMIRDGWYLAKLKSKFMNQKVMHSIRNKKVFAVM